jgi:GT2 family glycosyltransferase
MDLIEKSSTKPLVASKPLVSIIIVYYNTPVDTLELLASIKKLTYPTVEIIIVDNSNDLSFHQKIKQDFPSVILVKSKSNVGFAGGNNLGIKKATGEYLLFLNSDTLVFPNTLEPMVEFLNSHPEVGMASPKVLFPDGVTIQYAGARAISQITGRGKRIGLMEKDHGQFDCCKTTDLGHGAALIVPKKIVQEVGYWPTEYFLYYEEHDWCEQVKNAGYSIYYLGNSSIIHKEAMSTGGSQSALKVYYMTRNRLLFMRRNSKGGKLIMGVLFYFLFAVPKDFVKYLIKGQFTVIRSFFNGLIWHLKHLNLKVS